MPYCPSCTASTVPNATKCEACGAEFLRPNVGFLESRLTAEQEAALIFPKYFPTVLGVLGIGGAAWGLVATAVGASQIRGGILGVLILAAIAAMYLFSGYCGVRAIQRKYGWVRLNQVLWAVQVPAFVSPLLSYSFSTGGFVTAWLQLHPSFHIGGSTWLGSAFTLNFLTPGPLAVGINLFALVVSYYLSRGHRGHA